MALTAGEAEGIATWPERVIVVQRKK